jgi:CheY-like chemotaxis protein
MSERILVADDDHVTARFLHSLLSEKGYDVAVADDGEQALELVATHHPDLILSDMVMPYLDGMDLLRVLRGDVRLSRIPIILLSLKDREETALFGHQNLVKDLLPSVDNLGRAIDHARQGGEGSQEGLLEGVELVLREVLATLTRHGVVPVEAQGQPFDPAQHEAMAQIEDASVPGNTVVQVFQPGYQLRGRLLRPARVVVSKPPVGAETKTDDGSG